MDSRIKLFLDTESTGLHKNTTLVSIGIISEDGRKFYAELNDYDKSQVNEWIQKHVIDNMLFKDKNQFENYDESKKIWYYVCDKKSLKKHLSNWLSQFNEVEIWADCHSYDMVLFADIFGTAYDVPKNVYYITFDICTLLKYKGIDPNISRVEFSGLKGAQHNSLVDAEMVKACYEKLILL